MFSNCIHYQYIAIQVPVALSVMIQLFSLLNILLLTVWTNVNCGDDTQTQTAEELLLLRQGNRILQLENVADSVPNPVKYFRKVNTTSLAKSVSTPKPVIPTRKMNTTSLAKSVSTPKPKNPSQKVNNASSKKQTITYFPWKDGVNYTAFCESLKNQLNNFTGPMIIHNGYSGGLGHKFESMLHSVTYALIIKRPLSFAMLDTYWNNTNSCLKDIKYQGEKPIFKNPPYRVCTFSKNCLKNKTSIFSVPNEPLIFQDFRPHVFMKERLKAINKLSLSIQFSSWDHYISREVLDVLLARVSQYDFSQIVGMHIRSGGFLANYRERGYWLTSKELPNLKSFISNTMKKHSLPQMVYLTTDSDIIEQYLKNQFPNLIFIKERPFLRSHTTSGAQDKNFKGAFFDMYFSSLSSAILYTPVSKFSLAVRSLAATTKKYGLPLKFRVYT